MVYGNKRYRRIRLGIHPGAPFRDVLKTFEGLEIPDTGINSEHIKYALLEMINNSLRAHRAAGVVESIRICLELVDIPEASLRVVVRDRGRGFDPDSLPFSLQDDPSTIDLNSPAFHEYRRRNNFERFGMGLPLVLRTFDTFALEFHDRGGGAIPWDPENVRGTSITVSRILTGGGADGE